MQDFFYDREAQRYISYDIETAGSIRDRGIDHLQTMHEELSRQSRRLIDSSASVQIHAYGNEHQSKQFSLAKKPDCILDDILAKQKRGLKPYYQEKLGYKINGSNDGEYIEYEPGIDPSSNTKNRMVISKNNRKDKLLLPIQKASI